MPRSRRPMEYSVRSSRMQRREQRHDLGYCNVECTSCGALHWHAEKLSNSSDSSPKFGSCCRQGNVSVPFLKNPLQLLKNLFEHCDGRAEEFRKNIRQYNAALQFTSLGANIDKSLLQGRGTYCFKILGELRHRVGSLIPNEQEHAAYAQLYIYDSSVALNLRLKRNSNLSFFTMRELQSFLVENHSFAAKFKHAYEILREAEASGCVTSDLHAHLHVEVDSDKRRYNLPTSDEVSIIIPGNGEKAQGMRDIVLRMRNGPLVQVHECNPLYMPLHYVLLFPYGELGWYDSMRHVDSNRRVTLREYYAFRLYERKREYSLILRGGKLFQEYLVDIVAANEQNRLRWIELNQHIIRAELYSGLVDDVRNNNCELRDVGQRIILPSQHPGSARCLYERYLDSMAITRFHGHPDVFCTMTANPNWPEIHNALLPQQTATDRPDLVTRVFELKRRAVMEDIESMMILGKTEARVHTIEFQKRGLPHTHFLLFLRNKINDVRQVDNLISAEIPNPDEDPTLFQVVLKCMIHGPCGTQNPKAPCMVDGKCSKGFPKAFQESTQMDQDGYPLYKRTDDGKTYHVSGPVDGGFYASNADVVPFNKYILQKYQCHFNVEVCASVRAVKYIHKYIYKGHDRALMVIGNNTNEIKEYINGRWLGPHEAVYHMMEYSMHGEIPNVIRLVLHLSGQHMVIYSPNDDPNIVLERAERETTMLTMFFKACCESSYARQFTYQEFPRYFVWKKAKKVWEPRLQGGAIGRIYFCDPKCGERFYLRLLLTRIRGPQSFDDLKNGCATFKESCINRGYLQNEDEWRLCLEEAMFWKTGHQLRALFAMILMENNPHTPHLLWDHFKEPFCDDLLYKLQHTFGIIGSEEQVFDYGLYLVDEVLQGSGKSLKDFVGMPQFQNCWDDLIGNRFIAEQLAYDREELIESTPSQVASLNELQYAIFEKVIHSVSNKSGILFFLEGPGGSGKTYVYNTLAMKIRSEGKIVLCVASSGIAALLLVGGKTAHSTFGIPVCNLNDESFCNVKKNSLKGALFQKVELIIWDEAPMQHRHCIEAVDRSLQDIRDNKDLFGGITILFGGDFRQVLPVVPKGTRVETVDASIKKSFLWKYMHVYKLSTNLRLESSSLEEINFSQELLKIGNGSSYIDPINNLISLPHHMNVGSTVKSLILGIYPSLNIQNTSYDDTFWRDRSILSARNVDVQAINDSALDLFSKNCRDYYSVDEVEQDEHIQEGLNASSLYPVEYLNSLTPSGFPVAKLRLAIGCPIMVLRNIAPLQGLCNGSRLVVTRLNNHVIEAQILVGDHKGKLVLIPRITFLGDPKELAFTLKRKQFPIKVAFAMTINKSQGQSLRYVGIDLRFDVFNHGQLYVAMSRCTSSHNIKVLYGETNDMVNSTVNIVYSEVLLS